MTYGSAPYGSKAFGQTASFGLTTLAELMSAMNFCNPFDYILPLPDSSIDAADRAHLWGMYSGIAVGAPSEVVAIPARINMGAHGVLAGRHNKIGRGI